MKNKKIYVIPVYTWGGLGDNLLLTPALKALKQSDKHCEIVILSGFKNKSGLSIFENNKDIDKLVYISNRFKERLYVYYYLQRKAIFIDYNYSKYSPSIAYPKLPATELIGEILNVKVSDRQLVYNLTSYQETRAKELLNSIDNPVVINITSKCGPKQMWAMEKWETLVQSMPQYNFIQLGLESEEPVKGAINLLGKTTIGESIAILKQARSFIGVESFLAHATNAVGCSGVVLFGDSSPTIWGHSNNINISKNYRCSPCVDETYICPYGIKCMTDITVEEVANALEVQMGLTSMEVIDYKECVESEAL